MLPALVLLTFLPLLVAAMVVLIVFDGNRLVAITARAPWSEDVYRRYLPNLLAIMSRSGMKLPWPKRVNGWSIQWFRFRLRRLLRAQSAAMIDCADWHVGVWLYLHEHRLLINHAVNVAISDLAIQLAEGCPPGQREHYEAVIRDCHERQRDLLFAVRQRFGRLYVSLARELFAACCELEALFAEHGFHLHAGFLRISQLEDAVKQMSRAAQN